MRRTSSHIIINSVLLSLAPVSSALWPLALAATATLVRLAAVVAVVVSFAAPSHSQACAAGQPTSLGSVQVLSGPCPGGTGTLPRTTCQLLRVQCAGIPSIDVQVRVTEPDPRLALRGTVVLNSGGDGRFFYANLPFPGGTALLRTSQASSGWLSGFVRGFPS